MVKQQRQQRIPVGAIAGIAAVAITAGGGAAWWHWQNASDPRTSPSPTTSSSPSPSPVQSQAQQKVTIYWLKNTGNKLERVPETITTDAQQPDDALETAFTSLLAGPKDATTFSTTIPQGTKLLGLQMKQDGIHVNLSKEFTNGGGSASMTGRVAQVIYTATTLEPSAQVWIEVEGKPIETLGGEGLELQQPLTRQSFQENFTL